MTLLECRDLHYQLGDFQLTAQLKLEQGERYVLRAPSGSGKSTFLDLIAGFITPSSGEIRYGGTSWQNKKVEQRPVSYLFQQHNLFDHLTVAQNLKLAAKDGDFAALLDSVSLPASYLKKRPHELSGGEQQRVALARTLLLNRPIVLLDEPFSALDECTRKHVSDLTYRLQREHGWLLLAVSHEADDITALDAQALTIDNQHVIFNSDLT
ncbi:ATP-binding cassette domain-containing protein [Suttonella sp. R2A3]|uniref:ATP-binding cassette domain-containing protein n=1 Tax=Suttonella sp. R2A3 TaxID=2908648 RepID=UPI001F4354AA|nr:ATP-binding cassette domain-containing protein [Suttonella sp. R2A3]UJF24407.1 ATP-binding cassette domain-containing protein [Suttonella sp. R2A3]